MLQADAGTPGQVNSEPVSPDPQRHALKQWLRQLKVGQKIGLGYTISLSAAVIGTVAGFGIADRYSQVAQQKTDHVTQEINLLHRLQASLLQARTHQQQLIPLLQQFNDFQEEYGHLRSHAEIARSDWLNLQTFVEQNPISDDMHGQRIPTLLRRYRAIPAAYFDRLDQLVDSIRETKLQRPAAIAQMQRQLLDFTNGPLALQFDAISDQLTDIITAVQAERVEAEAAEAAVNTLRSQIILGSMALSVALAMLLAILTSRAIARPLEAVTNVAQQVTQDSNFGLQAPVTTRDEIGTLAVSFNQVIQRVEQLLAEQRATAAQQLLESEKMSSLGRMLAGVAHEINNPVNFIYGNLNHANDYITDLFELIHLYQAELPQPPQRIAAKTEDMDLEFLQEDLPKLLQSMKVGADRARQIVLSLRNFSRLDESLHAVDLHECLDSTLLILNNRIKKDVVVQRNYGQIPAVEGYASSLYQVFMNILSNALDALAEIPVPNPMITITTAALNADQVVVRLSDNGGGIAPEHQERIFETFFTTKPVGVGTGLGLAISRQIVEEKHGGRLTCQSQLGQGTEFSIILPIRQAAQPTKPVVMTA